MDSAKRSFSVEFLCVRESPLIAFLPGAVEYKDSSPREQPAKRFLDPQPVCTGPAQS